MAYSNLGQWDRAIADYSKAIELDSEQPIVFCWHTLARLGASDRDGYRSACTAMLESENLDPMGSDLMLTPASLNQSRQRGHMSWVWR